MMADEHIIPPKHPVEGHAPPAQFPAVQIKLPLFWLKDPALWFAQIKTQFLTRGITVLKTKLDHVVSFLAPEYATEVKDLLLEPPGEQPYETLKAQFTK